MEIYNTIPVELFPVRVYSRYWISFSIAYFIVSKICSIMFTSQYLGWNGKIPNSKEYSCNLNRTSGTYVEVCILVRTD